MKLIFNNLLKSVSSTAEEILEERLSFPALHECLDRLRERYGLQMRVEDTLKPVGFWALNGAFGPRFAIRLKAIAVVGWRTSPTRFTEPTKAKIEDLLPLVASHMSSKMPNQL